MGEISNKQTKSPYRINSLERNLAAATQKDEVRSIGVARWGAQGARAPPIEMLPMIKMSQKRLLFLLF